MIGKILLTGGIVNILMALFHVYLGYEISQSNSVTEAGMALILALNFALTIVFFFFGYIGIFQRKELVSTRIGKYSLIVIAVIYITRAFEEFILFEFSAFWFILCFALGFLYLTPFIFRKMTIIEM